MENNTFKQKITDVLKKYGYYILVGVLLFAIVLTIILVGVNGVNENKSPNITETNSTVTPYMPVLNASIYKGYSADELVFNSTLNQWETHKAVDFQVASGSKVYAILDGTVKDVYTNLLEGTVVVLEHDGGLTSTYASLDDEVDVNVGDKVYRGDEIGSVSDSAGFESEVGAHLHFSMSENDKKVDPASYLNISYDK